MDLFERLKNLSVGAKKLTLTFLQESLEKDLLLEERDQEENALFAELQAGGMLVDKLPSIEARGLQEAMNAEASQNSKPPIQKMEAGYQGRPTVFRHFVKTHSGLYTVNEVSQILAASYTDPKKIWYKLGYKLCKKDIRRDENGKLHATEYT